MGINGKRAIQKDQEKPADELEFERTKKMKMGNHLEKKEKQISLSDRR